MTLPQNIIFPMPPLSSLNGNESLNRYFREFIFTLQRMYEDIVQNVNGDIRSDTLDPTNRWIPLIKDTTDNTTTFNYDHQTGFVLRQGLITDVWFDVQWISVKNGTILGNMYLELPYKVIVTNDMPFVGVLQPSIFAYTGGTESVINAISNTYRGEIWNSGSGFTTANQISVGAGQLIGHIRYIGVSDE